MIISNGKKLSELRHPRSDWCFDILRNSTRWDSSSREKLMKLSEIITNRSQNKFLFWKQFELGHLLELGQKSRFLSQIVSILNFPGEHSLDINQNFTDHNTFCTKINLEQRHSRPFFTNLYQPNFILLQRVKYLSNIIVLFCTVNQRQRVIL